ncbi:MAG: 4-hydroxy-3-methylbut-2-enyl diphosphate reductase [Spirochaetaceae bacterium]|nr:4-hydroxy-3-methylbut-2-enyl diphosphate reductase [Spirochaetaceae bacterium]
MTKLSETYGMCMGAETSFAGAVKKLKEKRENGRVVVWGNLLHNKDVEKILEEKGAVIFDHEKDPENTRDNIRNDDTVIIRAHGETKEFIGYLKKRGIEYEDCTCINVRRVHEEIEKHHREGYAVIILGSKNHAEIIGSNGWCENQGILISDEDDLDALPDTIGEKVFVIAQTTMETEKFKNLSDAIAGRYGKVKIKNSLCGAQLKIQNDSVELAKQCDTMIVIGDKKSSNTRELFRKCKAVCPDTLQIESSGEFVKELVVNRSIAIDPGKIIGISGGASAPKSIIEECKQFIDSGKCREIAAFYDFYKTARTKIKNRMAEQNRELFSLADDAITGRIIDQFIAVNSSGKAKLLRGTLAALGYRIAQTNKDIEYSIDLAAAYEFFETAILVHDDVFDKSPERRGVKTIHTRNIQYYQDINQRNTLPKEEIKSAGEAAAICVGDLVFYFTSQMMVNRYHNDENFFRLFTYFNELVITTIKGELLDVVLPLEERLGITPAADIRDQVIKIDRIKTAGYTTVGPLSLGLILGGMDREHIAGLHEFAELLGITFQIQDDFLNIFGSAEQGKPCGSDIAEYKMTLFYAEACADAEVKQKLLAYYGREISAAELGEVRKILEASGIKGKIKKTITGNFEKCRVLLNSLDFIKGEEKAILLGFVSYLELRKS